MSKVITPAFKNITFSDGKTFEFEPLRGGGSGGWWYKPDHLRTPDEIRNNKNRSFGRGDEGYDAARSYMQGEVAKIKDHLLKYKVVSFETYGGEVEPSKNGITLAWRNKWGWQYVRFMSHRGNSVQMTGGMSPALHNVTQIIAGGTTDHLNQHATTYSVAYRNDGGRYGNQPTVPNADEAFELFMDKPIEFAKAHLSGNQHNATGTKIPQAFWTGSEKFEGLEWEGSDEWQHITPDHKYYVSQSTLLTNKSIAQDYIIDNLDDVRRLMDCIHVVTGARIDIRTRWINGDWERSMLDQVKFQLESDNDHKTPHTITIDVDMGVSVRCGYEEDDERYADWQRRQAMDFFEEVKDTESDDDTDEWLSSFNL